MNDKIKIVMEDKITFDYKGDFKELNETLYNETQWITIGSRITLRKDKIISIDVVSKNEY